MSLIRTAYNALANLFGVPVKYLVLHGTDDPTTHTSFTAAKAVAVPGDTITLPAKSISDVDVIDKNITVRGSDGTTLTSRCTMTAGGLFNVAVLTNNADRGISWEGTGPGAGGRIADITFLAVGATTTGTALHIEGTSRFDAARCELANGNLDHFVYADTGSQAHLIGLKAQTSAILNNSAYHIDGTATVRDCLSEAASPVEFDIYGIVKAYSPCSDKGAEAGVRVQAGANATIFEGCIDGAPLGLELVGECTVVTNGGSYSGTTFDFEVATAADASSVTLNSTYTSKNVSPAFLGGGKFFSSHFSGFGGDEGQLVNGQIACGNRFSPQEVIWGMGDSTPEGMVVLTNTNLELGPWANETVAAASAQTSSFTAFPVLTAGACLYFGSDFQGQGTKFSVETAIVLGGGTIINEQWNGSTWVETYVHTYNAAGDWVFKGHSPFVFVGSTHNLHSFWEAKALLSLNGSDPLYWNRWRIATGPITTAPIVQQIKIHTPRGEGERHGIAKFGDSEGFEVLPGYSIGDVAAMLGFTPSSASILWSTNMSFAFAHSFADNKNDGVGARVELPVWLDTSKRLRLSVTFSVANANAGNVVIDVRSRVNPAGATLDGSATDDIVQNLIAVGGTALKQYTVIIDGYVPTAAPGETLGLAFYRDATPGAPGPLFDTYTGAITIVGIELVGKRFRI